MITNAAKGIAPIDITSFGPPSAAFAVSGCGISQFFTPQQLVFDITLCESRPQPPPHATPVLTRGRARRWELVRHPSPSLATPPTHTDGARHRAGIPATYNAQCGPTGPTGVCYDDQVVGSGANFAQAYFEIAYLRAYTTGGVGPTPTPAVPGATLANAHVSATANSGARAAPRPGPRGEGAAGAWMAAGAVVLGLGWGAGLGLGWGLAEVGW